MTEQKPTAPTKEAPAAAKSAAAKGIYLEGMDGQIRLLPDRLIITRKGLFNILMYGLTAQREIPLGAISEVVFKEPTLLAPGHIEFVISGRNSVQAGKVNHNAVKFQKQKQPQFHALKEKVFALMEQANRQKAQ